MARMPEEVLQHIFSYLQPSLQEPYWRGCSQANRVRYSTLAAICRASRACHRLAVPILYNTIEIYGQKDDRRAGEESLGRRDNRDDLPDEARLEVSDYPSNIKLLLRTLLSNAHLATEVKRLKVEHFEIFPPYPVASEPEHFEIFPPYPLASEPEQERYPHEWLIEDVDEPISLHDRLRYPREGVAPESLGEEYQKRCKVAVKDLKLSSLLQTHLEDALAMGLEEGELAIVLALCSHLERLEFTAVCGSKRTLVMLVVNELMDRLQTSKNQQDNRLPFSRLREIALRNDFAPYNHYPFDIGEIGPLLRAPKLSLLQAHGMSLATFTYQPLPPHGSQLATLQIDKGLTDEGGFEDILKEFPSLRTITWSPMDGLAYNRTDFVSIAATLRRHGQMLESLTLDADSGEAGAPLSNLRPLKNLKHLAARRNALIGSCNYRTGACWPQEDEPQLVNQLPTSLETLEILRVSSIKTYFPKFIVAAEEPRKRMDWKHIDLDHLYPLMIDPTFVRLTKVRLERDMPFSGDLSAIDWEESRDGKWVVLRRQ